MITVGVNLLWCLPGRVGGSEEYLSRMLGPLPDVAPDVRLVLYTLPGFAAAHPEVADRHETVTAPVSGERRPLRVVAERTWMARDVRRRRLDVVHHGGGTAPGGLGPASVVLTMHDIQYAAYPEYFSALKRAWLERVIPAGLRRADVITAPTSFVRRSLVEVHGVDAQRVLVVPHGIPDGFAAATAAVDVAGEHDVRRRYRLPGPFLLYPAVTHPHKNHLLLVDVMERLATRHELRLVLIGGSGRGEDALQAALATRSVGSRIVRPGRVTDADRNTLLRAASALVFPSRYEGFGAPVLEAMAAGTPVLAADATALPEVLGSAGVLLDPDDAGAWARAVARLLDRPEKAAKLAAAGRERAAAFSDRRSAEALAVAYRTALARRPRP